MLNEKVCKPCEGNIPPLSEEEITSFKAQISDDWNIEDNSLTITWNFANFSDPFDFVILIGELAEEEGHHPEIAFGWGYATVNLTTHAINGLSENDFILASKIDCILKNEFESGEDDED